MSDSNRQIRDFILYLSGSLVVAFVAVIRLPIFTARFTPEDFGMFSLVSITYTYLSVVLYTWISSCIYRYYHECLEASGTGILYTNILALFGASSLILFLVTVTWYMTSANMAAAKLVIPAFGYLLTNQVVAMMLVISKIKGKSVQVNLFQTLQAVFSLLVVLALIFLKGKGIQAIFTGQIIVNIILVIIIFWINGDVLSVLKMANISFSFMKTLIRYGSIGFASALGVFILISSDRYVIALFEDIGKVGIYNQVYQVAQVSVYFLVTVFFNTVTPDLNKLLAGYSGEKKTQLTNYVNVFILMLLPVTFFVSVFSRQVSELLLHGEFQSGFGLIPWIVSGTFLYGVTLFSETKMKFEHRFRPVLWGLIWASLLNIVLNFICIPRWGYYWAAISTCVAYAFLFAYYYIKDDFHFLHNPTVLKTIFIAAGILLVEWMCDMLLRHGFHLQINKWYTVLEGGILTIIYVVLILKFKLLKIPSHSYNN